MRPYFYEILEPYSAVIKAHDEFEALKIYEEVVSDVENKEYFYQDLNVLNEEDLRKILDNTCVDDTSRLMSLQEQEEAINSKAPSIIVMEM